MLRRLAVLLFPSVLLAACATGQVAPLDIDASDPPDGGGGGDAACATKCGADCADLKADTKNCGKCGTVCPMGSKCVQGSCQCDQSQTQCQGACADLKTDAKNCGTCGTVCGGDGGVVMGGGMWACVNGSCAVTCPMGKTECGGACVDTKTDNTHCGMCNKACLMGEQCTESQCCKTGEMVCNGVCKNPLSDAQNCGMCGKVCSGGTPVCVAGNCVAGCADPNDVQFGGKCYYLNGTNGVCVGGYSKGSNAQLAAILAANPNAWQGKNYRSTVSSNCCVLTSDNVQNYGMGTHCNSNGPFSANEPLAGGAGCSNISPPIQGAGQLTLCASN